MIFARSASTVADQMLHAIGLLPLFVRRYKRDLCRNTREGVNVYTYHPRLC
jgi:hypothetical protein